MRYVTAIAVSALMAGAATAQAPAGKKKAMKFDAKKLIGKWEYVKGVNGGEEVGKERLVGTVEIKKDVMLIPSAPGMNPFEMAYKVTPRKGGVAKIEIEIKKGPFGVGGKAKGLVKFQGKNLVICYVPPAMDGAGKLKQPKNFKSTADNQAHVFVLKAKDD